VPPARKLHHKPQGIGGLDSSTALAYNSFIVEIRSNKTSGPRGNKMKLRFVLLLLPVLALAWGCSTSRSKDKDGDLTSLANAMNAMNRSTSTNRSNTANLGDLQKIFAPFLDPFSEIVVMRSGVIDLLYCCESFRVKNNRWPANYAELLEYVKQSNGYLLLKEYEGVVMTPLPDDRLQVRYVRPGSTNESTLTLLSATDKK
jgi:hypothetical protein